MHWDQEIGIPMAGGRDDGEWARSGEASAYREIGELLLRADELEDTLRVMETDPGLREPGSPVSSPEAIRRLEARLRSERAKIEELERRGAIRYDEVERAIRLSDAMG